MKLRTEINLPNIEVAVASVTNLSSVKIQKYAAITPLHLSQEGTDSVEKKYKSDMTFLSARNQFSRVSSQLVIN